MLLSSLLRSRWQLCCLTDAAHPLWVPLCLRFATLPQFPSTTDFYKLATACQGGIVSLTAVRTVENTRIVDRRKLVCTKTQYAERQRLIEAEANRISNANGGEQSNAAAQALPLPSACSIVDLQARNASLSLGGYKGGGSLSRKRTAPFARAEPQALLLPLCIMQRISQKSLDISAPRSYT